MSDKLGDKIRLQHMLDAIEDIESYTQDVTLEDTANSMMFNASIASA